jgi:hypothetical protein
MPQLAQVTATTLNLRRDPSTANPPIAQLSRGTSVSVLKRQGGWYEVRSGERTGWVFGDFLDVREERPAVGFLRHEPALLQIPLEPPVAERVDPASLPPARRPLAETWNRCGGLLRELSRIIDVQPAAAVAVLMAESSGRGFVNGRMVIRFENHVFHDRWGRSNEARFAAHFRLDRQKRWTGHAFRAAPDAAWESFHGSQDAEWRVFEFARGLNEAAAMRSISMGAPQIMGFNHAAIGYDSVQEMFASFSADERFQILGLFDFIKGPGTSSRMVRALQQRNYEQFATWYNGPGQAPVYGARIRGYVEGGERIPVMLA